MEETISFEGAHGSPAIEEAACLLLRGDKKASVKVTQKQKSHRLLKAVTSRLNDNTTV